MAERQKKDKIKANNYILHTKGFKRKKGKKERKKEKKTKETKRKKSGKKKEIYKGKNTHSHPLYSNIEKKNLD